jgi:hypothetical protein
MLIDLRPANVVGRVEVGSGGHDDVAVGNLLVDDHRRQRHAAADIALAAVLDRGLFVIEAAREFTFRRYADSAEELRDYIASNWQDTRLDDETCWRAAEAIRVDPGARVWVTEFVGIRSLRPL